MTPASTAMTLLLTEAAFERVRAHATMSHVEPILLLSDGTHATAGGESVDGPVDADLVWASADAYLAGSIRSLLASAVLSERTRWLQTFSAGVDDPAFTRLLEKGVRVTKSDAQAVPIAEYVLAHALSLMVPIEAQAELQTERRWNRTPYTEVSLSRWLLVGYGSIGQEITTRVKVFGSHLTVARQQAVAAGPADETIGMDGIQRTLGTSDVVVLACPLTDETAGLAGPDFFAAMKPGSLLINIGRGGLVDEAALIGGLAADRPRRAVLDVFATEPLPQDSQLWTHPQVRVSAHTAASGSGTLARGDALFLDNLDRHLSGRSLRNEVDPRSGAAKAA